MRAHTIAIAALAFFIAGSAEAAFKYYNASRENGLPGDLLLIATNICPTVQTTPGIIEGWFLLEDDGLGTVTLHPGSGEADVLIDLGIEQLVTTFGPGAFLFIDQRTTSSTSAPALSNTSGVGAHGPSGTAPGETAEWGVVSGFFQTGFQFCISSPVALCNENGFSHGATNFPVLPSSTYDLGTWNFDAVGDMAGENFFIQRTSSGGLSNSGAIQRGAFQGASLPALPLVGFGALALSLALLGARAITGKK